MGYQLRHKQSGQIIKFKNKSVFEYCKKSDSYEESIVKTVERKLKFDDEILIDYEIIEDKENNDIKKNETKKFKKIKFDKK